MSARTMPLLMTEIPVIVTRPAAQAVELSRRIAAIGRQVVQFPLLEILPTPDPVRLRETLSEVERYALVAFVSPNAVDAALAVRPDWPCRIPLAVVGEGSRAALARHGLDETRCTIYSPRDPERSDSETLLTELDLPALAGRDVLIVRGETGRELLGDALRAAGVRVTPLAAYRRVAPEWTSARRGELMRLLAGQSDWIVTSSEALRFLLAMVEQLGHASYVAKMQQQQLIVPHMRIAETARSLGFTRIVQTRSGDDGLFAALQSLS